MSDFEVCLLIGWILFVGIGLLEAWKIDRLQERISFYQRMSREQMRLIKALRDKSDVQAKAIAIRDEEIDIRDNMIEKLQEKISEAERKNNGKWIPDTMGIGDPFSPQEETTIDCVICSVCGVVLDCSEGRNYCPNCGAKMDKGE